MVDSKSILEKSDESAVIKTIKKKKKSVKMRQNLYKFRMAKKSGTKLSHKQNNVDNTDPEINIKKKNILVTINSNIWGTKFKFNGHKNLPESIGQITYKTSLFHLQPRQMKIVIDDLSINSENQTKCKCIKNKSKPNNIVKSKTSMFANPVNPSLPKNQSLNLLNEKLNLVDSAANNKIEKSSNQMKNLISLKTSATLSAIPVLDKKSSKKTLFNVNFSDTNSIDLNELSNNIGFKNQSSFESLTHSLAYCNDEIATVHELVEKKFNYNGGFFDKFNLPVLRLASDNLELEDYDENNLIISHTGTNHLDGEIDDEEIHLLASSSTSSSIKLSPSINTSLNVPMATTTSTTTTSLTTTIYPKNHLKSSKYSFINKLNKHGEFLFTSSQLFNYFFNRKNFLLEKVDYQKLDENKLESFNTVNMGSNKLADKIEQNNDDSKADEDIYELNHSDNESQDKNKQSNSNGSSRKKRNSLKNQFILYNKPPIWNETNQVKFFLYF